MMPLHSQHHSGLYRMPDGTPLPWKSKMDMPRRAVRIALLVSVLAVSACGFRLRGSDGAANLPFKTIYLAMPATSPLGIELRRNIHANGGTTIVSDAKEADARLELLSESRDKVIESLNTQGRIRQYSLYYRMSFRVRGKGDVELLPTTQIVLKRDISFNESQALAKESEEALLYRDMQGDLVQQILRRLAAIRPPA